MLLLVAELIAAGLLIVGAILIIRELSKGHLAAMANFEFADFAYSGFGAGIGFVFAAGLILVAIIISSKLTSGSVTRLVHPQVEERDELKVKGK